MRAPSPGRRTLRQNSAARATGKTAPLGAYILETADRLPEKIAIVDGDVRLSYAELANRMDAAAERLLQLGLKADDRIMVQLPNGWQFTVLTLACFRAGIIPVMALPAHRQYELSFLTELSESRAIAVPDVIKDFDHQAMAEELALKHSVSGDHPRFRCSEPPERTSRGHPGTRQGRVGRPRTAGRRRRRRLTRRPCSCSRGAPPACPNSSPGPTTTTPTTSKPRPFPPESPRTPSIWAPFRPATTSRWPARASSESCSPVAA